MPITLLPKNLPLWIKTLIMIRELITVFGSMVMFLTSLPIMLVAMPSMANDDVMRAETWFNKIRTISADFVQVASDGTSAEGKLAFRRPSRMKITYGKGDELQLITSSIWLHVDRPDERLLTSYPVLKPRFRLFWRIRSRFGLMDMKRVFYRPLLALCGFKLVKMMAKALAV